MKVLIVRVRMLIVVGLALIPCTVARAQGTTSAMPKGALSGVVLDAGTKQPIDGAELTLYRDGVGREYWDEETLADGQFYDFSRDGMRSDVDWDRAPGHYRLKVTADGYEPYEGLLVIEPGQELKQTVLLKRRSGFDLVADGGIDHSTFSNADTVCRDKVGPDFLNARYEQSSCGAESSANTWHAGVTAEKLLTSKVGFRAGFTFRALEGPATTYKGTRVQNSLSFQGGGTNDLKVVQLAIGPSIFLTRNLVVSPSLIVDRWSNHFEIKNALRSAGQLVNESNASDSTSGTAINYGVSVDWFPGGGPVGLRVDAQSLRIDDLVQTTVTGLPKDQRGYVMSVSGVLRVSRLLRGKQ